MEAADPLSPLDSTIYQGARIEVVIRFKGDHYKIVRFGPRWTYLGDGDGDDEPWTCDSNGLHEGDDRR